MCECDFETSTLRRPLFTTAFNPRKEKRRRKDYEEQIRAQIFAHNYNKGVLCIIHTVEHNYIYVLVIKKIIIIIIIFI